MIVQVFFYVTISFFPSNSAEFKILPESWLLAVAASVLLRCRSSAISAALWVSELGDLPSQFL